MFSRDIFVCAILDCIRFSSYSKWYQYIGLANSIYCSSSPDQDLEKKLSFNRYFGTFLNWSFFLLFFILLSKQKLEK